MMVIGPIVPGPMGGIALAAGGKPERETRKGRLSGRAARKPRRVASAINDAYWLW